MRLFFVGMMTLLLSACAPQQGQTILVSGDPSFALVNTSGYTIREVYASSSRAGGWGRDRLGQYVLSPGENIWVSLPSGGGCITDVMVVYNNGRSREMRNVETCSVRSISM